VWQNGEFMNQVNTGLETMQQQSKKGLSSQQGFTLLEVMVVVVIIAIMAAAVAPALIGNIDDAQKKRVISDLASIETSLNLYKLDNFQYPSTDQGLEALVSKPSGDPPAKAWKQRLPKIPIDPWKNPYKYLSPGTHGEFDVYSLGPDGRQSEDDIGNWNKDEQ
jgi:general secretion pathway protein G